MKSLVCPIRFQLDGESSVCKQICPVTWTENISCKCTTLFSYIIFCWNYHFSQFSDGVKLLVPGIVHVTIGYSKHGLISILHCETIKLFLKIICQHYSDSQNMTWHLRNEVPSGWPPLWSGGEIFWLQIQRSWVRFLALPDCVSSSCLERGPLSLMSTIEELLERKSSGSGIRTWEYGRRDPPRWPHDTLSAKVGSNFADKCQSLIQCSLLVD
jgi:hypothetical protein